MLTAYLAKKLTFATPGPTMGAGLWTTLLAYAGYWLGANFQQVETYLDPASYVVLAGIAGLYVWRVITHKGQRGPQERRR